MPACSQPNWLKPIFVTPTALAESILAPPPDLKQGNALLVLTFEGRGTEQLSQEAGGHRIQRVPANERRGRVHSSTVTVAALDPSDRLELPHHQRDAQDFEVTFFSGTGPGGQNRNKVQASARILHRPTGLVRTAQTRSRENSVRLAMEALHQALDGDAEQAQQADLRQKRQSQIGSGERGDKRRTYRLQEDQVVDHLSGRKARASDVLKGQFNALWAPGAAQMTK